MIRFMGAAAMIDPRDVNRVRKDPIQMASAELAAAERSTRRCPAPWRAHARLLQLHGKQPDVAELGISDKDVADDGGVLLDDSEAASVGTISNWRRTTHPHAARLGLCDLVADALGGDLALKLREGQQHVQGEPTHAVGSAERLRDGDKAGTRLVEGFDQLGEVQERA